MIELKLLAKTSNFSVYTILDEGIEVGSVELIEDNTLYLEDIYRSQEYKGKGYLKQVINILKDKFKRDIECLPLNKYRSYYEELGFVEKQRNNEDDIYYILKV